MRALTITPGVPNSARLDDVPAPSPSEGPVLVQTLAVGVCGTDMELVSGRFGAAPAGQDRLILGHESLGRVLDAPAGSGLSPGDLVAGIVRRPDPDPCPACEAGEWDFCRDGRFTEHGIVGRHGFAVERFRSDPGFLVKVDPRLGPLGVLLEPASVVAKAWEQIERIAARSAWRPRHVLIAGAGPIGLLAALMGVQRGLEVQVLDRVPDGPKPDLVRDLGATYHAGSASDAVRSAEIVIECTGAAAVVLDVLHHAAGATVCILGGCHERETIPFDLTRFTHRLIGGNGVVFGSVNSNRRHYEAASRSLAAADPHWLPRLITRRVPLDRWEETLCRDLGDVKPVIDFGKSDR
jgi:threonine dehydrogenase-like Zn-dependent dehydrogenase